MERTKFKTDAFEAIHSAASGMERAGVIEKQTMRDYDAMCIEKPGPAPDSSGNRQKQKDPRTIR